MNNLEHPFFLFPRRLFPPKCASSSPFFGSTHWSIMSLFAGKTNDDMEEFFTQELLRDWWSFFALDNRNGKTQSRRKMKFQLERWSWVPLTLWLLEWKWGSKVSCSSIFHVHSWKNTAMQSYRKLFVQWTFCSGIQHFCHEFRQLCTRMSHLEQS